MPELIGGEDLEAIKKQVVDPDLVDGGLRSKKFATVFDLLGYGEIDSIFVKVGDLIAPGQKILSIKTSTEKQKSEVLTSSYILIQ